MSVCFGMLRRERSRLSGETLACVRTRIAAVMFSAHNTRKRERWKKNKAIVYCCYVLLNRHVCMHIFAALNKCDDDYATRSLSRISGLLSTSPRCSKSPHYISSGNYPRRLRCERRFRKLWFAFHEVKFFRPLFPLLFLIRCECTRSLLLHLLAARKRLARPLKSFPGMW